MKNLKHYTIKAMLLLAVLGGALGANAQKSNTTENPPNVVLILADNVGYGDISAYNLGIRGGMKTPNIDKIGEEGVQLTQFLVEPGCTPTRAGLMTGPPGS